ncbi:MAG: RnfABCDGE type electron transport complex subunit D [Limnochordia bacterium]
MQIKTGPFLRSPLTIERIMGDVLIALMPAVVAGVVFFGWRALLLLVLSTLSAILTEALLTRAPLTPQGIFGDGSAAVTGLLVGLILPSTAAWWIPIVGSFLAIALVKLAFGGLGYNIFNPALGARAILLLAFTSQMVRFTVPFDVVTGATPLLSTRSFSWSLVWGNVGGSIGETSVIAILLGAIYLFYRGHINWRIPLGYIGSAFVLALIWGLDPWYTITAGGLMFAAFFMATDMVTSPVTHLGQLVFGVGCGVLTLVIRQFTPLPEGVTFAVLVMNALAPALESLTIATIFGVGASREARLKRVAVAAAAVVVLVGVFIVLDQNQPATLPVLHSGQYLPLADLLGDSDYEVVDQEGTRYYLVRDEEGNPAQVAFIAEQGGFNAPIRFLLVLDTEHAIHSVTILEHREDPGLGELITRPSFLEQFAGLDKDSSFSLGDEIQAISGATISSRALASGVSKALELFNVAFYGQEELGALMDGTYLGQADSFGGPLELELVVAGGKIASVAVLSHSDTPGISDPAMQEVPGRIVAANSADVDAASGATVSSAAIMKAATQALEKAAAGEEAEESSALIDGTYLGQADSFGGPLELELVVAGGKIASVTVLSHSDTPGISDPAMQEVPGRIVAANSADVDAASGATVSSAAIMKAATQALEKAAAGEEAEESSALIDGTYLGQADSFGGPLELELVVAGGKIASVAVLSHSDTPGISDPAMQEVPGRIVAANSADVDAASGATVSSAAIMKAATQALEKAAAGEEAEESSALIDGTYLGQADSFGGPLELELVVAGGKIASVAVLSHSDTPGISDPAMQEVPGRIVAANSADVDAASGATVSSAAIMKAATQALEKAAAGEEAEESSALIDGTYLGQADSFGGPLELELVVAGGKIASVAVLSHSDTPGISDPAMQEVPGRIVAANSADVDAASGATVSSAAIMKAATQALEKAAAGEEAEESSALIDGTYLGQADSFGGPLELELVVAGGKIASVAVLSHSDTPGISDPAMQEVPGRIVAANSADVDAASGATVSSAAIMKAATQALEKAAAGEPAPQSEPFTVNVADGVHRGSAQGFGGELILDVTVMDGKIVEIVVVESAETPFIADAAFEELLPALIENQGPVDAVSGATYTSEAVLAAVEQALSGAGSAPEEEVVPVFTVNVADGVHRGRGQGFGGELILDVTVMDGKIVEIVVVESAETPFIADAAFEELLPALIENQGPVDAVSGATYTSEAVLAAVEQALSGAGSAPEEEVVPVFTVNVADGVHRGRGQGFGGELILDVTVMDGKIVEIVVVESAETPFIADAAFEELLPALIENQGPVDAVSGATYTSEAVLAAVEQALSGAGSAPEEEVVAAFTVNVADGVHRGRGQGFGGELILDVTVMDGKIVEIVVVESAETPFIADAAFEELLPALIENQGPVDAVSGATVTSKAVHEALTAALGIKEGQ